MRDSPSKSRMRDCSSFEGNVLRLAYDDTNDDISQKFPGKTHYVCKNGRMPMQLIIFVDFWAKMLTIADRKLFLFTSLTHTHTHTPPHLHEVSPYFARIQLCNMEKISYHVIT